MLEDEVQQLILIESARHGEVLLRNNSGALPDKTGRLVRYGLGNISDRINAQFKSSDLIGIKPVLITQEMVGTTIGVFMAVEVKRENWTLNLKDKREYAQNNFLTWVRNHGGIGIFANSVDSFLKQMKY